MKIKFCGASREVTGSKHVIEINNQKILLDCGLFQGGPKLEVRKKNSEFLFDPKEIDAVVLSHAHIDHAGLLPLLVKQGFEGPIFCTKPTKDLALPLLMDTAYLQKQDAEYVYRHYKEKVPVLFEAEDVKKTIKQMQTFNYGEKFKVGKGVTGTFQDAGHVFGSAIVVLDLKEENKAKKKLVFTGDLGQKYMPIINDPYQIRQADILITESTYASHLHDSFQNVHKELTQVVNDVVNRGGKIIIPGFSLERTQELVYVLHELYDQGKIPKIPVYVDSPLSLKLFKVFRKYKNYYDNETFRDFLSKKKDPFSFESLTYIETTEQSKALNFKKKPCIIISASGMCQGGRIVHHLRNNISDPKNLVLVVGFMAKGTRGRDLVEKKRQIKIFNEYIDLKADVVVMNAFSAHADKLELLNYIRHIKGLKNVFVVHGEESETLVMRDNIYNELHFKGKVEVPQMGEEFEV